MSGSLNPQPHLQKIFLLWVVVLGSNLSVVKWIKLFLFGGIFFRNPFNFIPTHLPPFSSLNDWVFDFVFGFGFEYFLIFMQSCRMNNDDAVCSNSGLVDFFVHSSTSSMFFMVARQAQWFHCVAYCFCSYLQCFLMIFDEKWAPPHIGALSLD